MKPHVTDFYKDGPRKIEFCTICSAEGWNLTLDCVGIATDKNQMNLFEQTFEKDVDTGN